jgi:hypothetical protein
MGMNDQCLADSFIFKKAIHSFPALWLVFTTSLDFEDKYMGVLVKQLIIQVLEGKHETFTQKL